MIIGNKNQGTVAKGSGSEGIVYCDDSTIVYAPPVFNGADGSLIRETIPYVVLASVGISSSVLTFQSPKAIVFAILAGCRFVNPAWVTKYSGTFMVACV